MALKKVELQCELLWWIQTFMENQFNGQGRHCFEKIISIDTRELVAALGCRVNFTKAILLEMAIRHAVVTQERHYFQRHHQIGLA